jgi:hypothetical protein
MLQGNMWTNHGNKKITQTHEYGNWDEAAQFPEKEYINEIFFPVHINGSANASPFSMTLRM